jgi:hypothetical protein
MILNNFNLGAVVILLVFSNQTASSGSCIAIKFENLQKKNPLQYQ